MSIGPTTYFGKERVFVDREACIQAFRENIQNSRDKEYNILYYHGIAGIGKSKLQTELQKILNEEYPEILWISIDLGVKTYREVGTFLITLRNKIQEKCNAKFYLFNAVHAIYWKKLHPEIPLQKQNYPLIDKGGFLEKIINVLDSSGQANFAWEILNSASEGFRKWCNLHHIDISKIESLEPNKIEELLPGFFAVDFLEYLGESSKVYIFIDTYEALWENVTQGSFHEKDSWIRDNLIQNMLGVSWVICGREKLFWVEEVDSEWCSYLKQRPLDELPEGFCVEFLEECGVENKAIQNVIIKASEGVPFYLDLSVDTYEKIQRMRKPIPENFGKTQPEIFNTFVKYLDKNEILILEVLSVPSFWDRNLFKLLTEEFVISCSQTSFSNIIRFSFIKNEDGVKYSIHQLMKKSLQEYLEKCDPKLNENVHRFLFEYYNSKLNEIDLKRISAETPEEILNETVYHGRIIYRENEVEFLDWYNKIFEMLLEKVRWKFILPLHAEIFKSAKMKLENKNPEFIKCLVNFALLHHNMGDYKESIELYEYFQELLKQEVEVEKKLVSAAFNNLARLYKDMGRYEEALHNYEYVLEIQKEIPDFDSRQMAITMNNMAQIHQIRGDYEKTLDLLKSSLQIRQNIFGNFHPSVATVINNMAIVLMDMREYETAFTLLNNALEIVEQNFGPHHHKTGNVVLNIAEIYHHLDKFEESIKAYQRVKKIYKNFLNPNHLRFAVLYNNMASTYQDMSKYEKSIEFYHHSLDILQSNFGSSHPNSATTLSNLASAYHSIGELEKALSLCQQAVDICEHKLGEDNPQIAKTLNIMAELYSDMEKYDEAISSLERALCIIENKLGPDHPSFGETMNNLIVLYGKI